MGQQQSKQYNFEDVQQMIKNKNTIIINVLPTSQQTCLIKNTLSINSEVKIMNELLKTNKSVTIIVYGKNTSDINVKKKQGQLISLGFYNVFIYMGGLFEWLLLQDIYGKDEFPTTSEELDLLKFKPPSNYYNNNLLIRDVD
jgi:hypothetical protein